jgi:hypothetical protein
LTVIGVVADNHALDAAHAADAGDDAAGGNPVAVQFVSRQLADLEERRAGIEQAVDAVAHEHLVARLVLFTCSRRTADRDLRDEFTQLAGKPAVGLGVGEIVLTRAIDAGLDDAHGGLPCFSRDGSR